MLRGGAFFLNARRQQINELNVFPIPDGDTGDNMYMTLEAGLDVPGESLEAVAEAGPAPAAPKVDLGADSLDILQLLMRIEDKYGITIPDEALATFETVSDVVAYLERIEG